DRRAFVESNFAYPKMERVTVNLLDRLAGKTIRVRFRVGTDSFYAGSATGWDIDNISFQGIPNRPFPRPPPDGGQCGEGPRPKNTVAKGGCRAAPGAAGDTTVLACAVLALALLTRSRRRSDPR